MFTASFVYEVPFLKGKSWLSNAFGNWSVDALITAATGLPVYVISGRDFSLTVMPHLAQNKYKPNEKCHEAAMIPTT